MAISVIVPSCSVTAKEAQAFLESIGDSLGDSVKALTPDYKEYRLCSVWSERGVIGWEKESYYNSEDRQEIEITELMIWSNEQWEPVLREHIISYPCGSRTVQREPIKPVSDLVITGLKPTLVLLPPKVV